jgi:hypothetical protein
MYIIHSFGGFFNTVFERRLQITYRRCRFPRTGQRERAIPDVNSLDDGIQGNKTASVRFCCFEFLSPSKTRGQLSTLPSMAERQFVCPTRMSALDIVPSFSYEKLGTHK